MTSGRWHLANGIWPAPARISSPHAQHCGAIADPAAQNRPGLYGRFMRAGAGAGILARSSDA
jgi:hypothetical protein